MQLRMSPAFTWFILQPILPPFSLSHISHFALPFQTVQGVIKSLIEGKEANKCRVSQLQLCATIGDSEDLL